MEWQTVSTLIKLFAQACLSEILGTDGMANSVDLDQTAQACLSENLGTDGMANSVDLDQTVCTGLSV